MINFSDYEIKKIEQVYDVKVVRQNNDSLTTEEYDITRDSYSYHEIDKEQACLKAGLGYSVSDKAFKTFRLEQLINDYNYANKQLEYYQNKVKAIKAEIDSINN